MRNESGTTQEYLAGAGSKRPPVQLPVHSRGEKGNKGSKGSSMNSFDLGYAQVTSNQKWSHGLAGRSSSFDFGSDRHAVNMQNAMARQVDTSFSDYDYDAAPTPTVPVGPRRARPASPILMSQDSMLSEVAPQKLERKRSTRSSKSAYKAKASATDYGLHDRARELPPLPAFMKEPSAPAPGPLVGYGKSKESTTQMPTPTKEKQGFFRRVFGSSRNSPVSVPEPPRSHGSTTSAETADRQNRPPHIANQIKSQNAPPPREPPPPPRDQPHVITKKPSSFFRRRKKSVSEDSVPAVPPIALHTDRDDLIPKPLDSPVSSLRKVMNPYIAAPTKNFSSDQYRQEQLHDQEAHKARTARGFSPDYEPDKSATIRTVKPPSRGPADSISSSFQTAQRPTLSAAQSYDSASKENQNSSFIQDTKENDLTGTDLKETTWLGTIKPTSPAVARDMALVAEYERVHSKRSPTAGKFDNNRASPTSDSIRSPMDSRTNLMKTVAKPPVLKSDEWVKVAVPSKADAENKENRVWLEPSSSEEELAPSSAKLPVPTRGEPSARSSGSTDTIYKSATSLPILRIEGEEEDSATPALKHTMITAAEALKALDKVVPNADENTASEEDRERAQQIYDGNEGFVPKEKAAAWMGEDGLARTRILVAYMELYDFTNLNILAALRVMCGKLVLKAESQQVDRILDRFAQRWCQCNPDHGFKVTGKCCGCCS